MKCTVYKTLRRQDTYLYVEREDDFARVPEPLKQMLGPLELVLALELTPERKLARADADHVRRQLREQGYYLQMPPKGNLPE